MSAINLRLLGQSGCQIKVGDTTIYVDPYLSNSVQELDAPDLRRLLPIPIKPEEVTDADWVLITHEHIDHCDPHTLPAIADASPSCRFVGPSGVVERLAGWGVTSSRCYTVSGDWISLSEGLQLISIPAAHPEVQRDSEGNPLCVGYILEVAKKRLYIAGDTSVTDELIDALKQVLPISTAILPVNEQNYFRSRRGIIGNMSVREAFTLAEELSIDRIIPVHWDMFDINSVSPDEIVAVYKQMNPSFKLEMQPTQVEL